MQYQKSRTLVAAALMAAFITGGGLSAAEPQTSARMEKAKDYIAEEQWVRAIEVLKEAAADAKEKHRDEALFWLAHSQHQARELRGALETISQLERMYPTSRWVKPAGSLRVELAQKLRNVDVLWWTATTEPVPSVVTPMPGEAPRMLRTPPGRRPTATPVVPGEAPEPSRPGTAATPQPTPPAPPRATVASGSRGGGRPTQPTPRPSTVWVTEHSVTDSNQRIQALGSLIKTDAVRVIPMLREIALESKNPREASRAVFLLAQSGRADAHTAVLEVARTASEPVSVAAVRELGRFGGEHVSRELLKVYASAKPRVKYQVVNSLGERAAATALMQIAESESNEQLRSAAIVTLGQAGGRQQLQRLYERSADAWKRPIIRGLFNARAEDELIRIAQRERDLDLRREIHAHLRVLGTVKAKAYLEKARTDR